MTILQQETLKMIFHEPDTALQINQIKHFLGKFSQNSRQTVYWLSTPDMSKIEYISPSFEEIWGQSRETLYEHPELWITYLHPDDQHKYHPIHKLSEQIKTNPQSASFNENYKIVKPNGEVRYILDRGFPIFDSQGQCIAVTGVAVDVTNEHRYEAILLQEKEMAQQANQLKTELLVNARHDFRTAFMGILSISDVMAQDEEDPEKKEYLETIKQSAAQLLKQHDELLEMAQIEDGFMDITCTAIKIKDLVQEMHATLLPAAVHKQLSLEWSVEDNVPETIRTDSMRIKRILINLTSNAIKFTEQGYVKLRVYLTDGVEPYVNFVIEDSGIGISKEKQSIIFEPFSKISPSHKGQFTGNGLGLRTVKRFADDINAKVTMKSTPGKGSHFMVSLRY
jgi:PAS domain S-box-containing protein